MQRNSETLDGLKRFVRRVYRATVVTCARWLDRFVRDCEHAGGEKIRRLRNERLPVRECVPDAPGRAADRPLEPAGVADA
jgi:hypothetical protein